MISDGECSFKSVKPACIGESEMLVGFGTESCNERSIRRSERRDVKMYLATRLFMIT